jgi:curved DNA-binding protein CbpA
MDDYLEALKVLGLERGASEEEIRRAYFHLVRRHPPETDPDGFQEIRRAYLLVRDVDRRAEFELSDLDPSPPPAVPFVLEPLKPTDISLEPHSLLSDEKVGIEDICRIFLQKRGKGRRKRRREPEHREDNGQQTLF